MPMKPVVVRRWEILAAFAILTFAFVGVSVWLTSIASSAHRAARAARVDAAQIGRVDKRVITIRNGEIRLLCRAERDSTLALRRILLLAQGLAAQSHNLTPEQRRQTVSFYSRALPLTRPIDCAKLAKKTPTP